MTVTWTQLSTSDAGSGNNIVTTRVLKGTGTSSGYLIRIDKTYYADGKAAGIPLTCQALGTGTAPASVLWTEESTDTISTDGGVIVERTLKGTPLDGDNNPIGSGRFYFTERVCTFEEEPTIGASMSIVWAA